MKRRLPTLITTLALGAGAAFGLAACGDDNDEPEIAPVEINDTTVTDTATEETTTEGTETQDTNAGSSGLGY